jgi:ankyrin repeat protein
MAEFLPGAQHERQQGKIATRNFKRTKKAAFRLHLHRASQSGLLDVEKLLLRRGADVDLLNKTGPKKKPSH